MNMNSYWWVAAIQLHGTGGNWYKSECPVPTKTWGGGNSKQKKAPGKNKLGFRGSWIQAPMQVRNATMAGQEGIRHSLGKVSIKDWAYEEVGLG